MFLHSKSHHTHYAGSYLLVNAHEVGIISGLAAAYALGAGYPEELEEDDFARLCFRSFLGLIHGKWFSRGEGVKSK
jgi:predicted NAD/FAD-binding protein